MRTWSVPEADQDPPGRRRRAFRHPAQIIAAAFAGGIGVGTALLMLPIARSGPGGAPFITALFHATSAVCVTGLSTVDTPNYWSGFGQAVILLLIQIGGLGIMTTASVLVLVVSRRLRLRSQLTAAAETKSVTLGEVRRLIATVVLISLACEVVVAVVLALRWGVGYDLPVGRAIYLGVFHAISAFNNAGFALFSDNLIGFALDPWICIPIGAAVFVGGLGFPVITELWRRLPARHWSMHTKLTIITSVALLVIGWVFLTANEWTNTKTIGAVSVPGKVLEGWFHSVMPRTAGFNAWDYGQVRDGTLLGTTMLMFIGGGSAGTAGGVKVTTVAVLLLVLITEARGEDDVNVFGRRIDSRAIRQALTVTVLGLVAVLISTLLLTVLTPFRLAAVLFEATSAFATVGLSTGITPQLDSPAQLILIFLMFLGRLGPITLVSALALRDNQRHYRFPEGRPIIG